MLRVIARLNIGGPAIQAISLTKLLEQRGYVTRLVRGRESPHEGNMDALARELGVTPTFVPSLRRDPGPRDLHALAALIRLIQRDRPAIVHTHAAKAGTLGRVAGLIGLRSTRPILVHTFHGHSLSGYFSGPTAWLFRAIERSLARRSDALIAVSEEVRDELVALGVAPAERFTVVPLGFDLGRFIDDTDRSQRRGALRKEWGVADEDEVVTLVARLVPIKRVDRFLRIALLLADRPNVRFVVVGDGELREQLVNSTDAAALDGRLHWAGFRADMPEVCFASDVVVLTSDNEGTPVSLIEAQAAAVPVVGTDAGGVRSALRAGETGLLVGVHDERGAADAIAAILNDPARAERMAAAGREFAARSFSITRLLNDLDDLYRSLIGSKGGR